MRRIADVGAAVIGTGFIGTVHVEALRRIGVQVRGVLGSTPERGAARADSLGRPARLRVARRPARRPGVEVVHVTSPNDLHLPHAKAALAAGRHVVCEKPLAMSATESRELVELAASTGLVNAANFNIRYYPLNQHAHEVVHVGRDRRCPAGHRPLLPGLAPARERLELAARARPRRRAPGGRRHRLALARPDDVRDRPARRRGDGRPRAPSSAPGASRPDRSRPSRPRSRPTRSPASSPPRTRRRSCSASRTGPAARSASARSAPGGRTRSSTRSTGRARRSPGIRSSPTRSGSAIATARTRS